MSGTGYASFPNQLGFSASRGQWPTVFNYGIENVPFSGQLSTSLVGAAPNAGSKGHPNEVFFPFFGRNGRALEKDPTWQYDREVMNLPEAFKGPNPYISQILITTISEADRWPIRVALPLKQNEQGMTVKWEIWRFNDHALNRTPEQSVSRLVTSTRDETSDTIVRYGIAFMLEHGFYRTPRGIQTYYANLQQIANATIETLCLGVQQELLHVDQTKWVHDTVTHLNSWNDYKMVIAKEIRMTMITQKDVNGFLLAWDDLQKSFWKINKALPNLCIVGEGVAKWAANLQGLTVGGTSKEIKQRMTVPGATVLEFRGVQVDSAKQDINPSKLNLWLSSAVKLDLKFLHGVPPEQFRTAALSRMAHDEISNTYFRADYVKWLPMCGLFQRTDYSNGRHGPERRHFGAKLGDRARQAVRASGVSPDPDASDPTWTMTRLGREFFEGFSVWGEYMDDARIKGKWKKSLLARSPEVKKAFVQLCAAYTSMPMSEEGVKAAKSNVESVLGAKDHEIDALIEEFKAQWKGGKTTKKTASTADVELGGESEEDEEFKRASKSAYTYLDLVKADAKQPDYRKYAARLLVDVLEANEARFRDKAAYDRYVDVRNIAQGQEFKTDTPERRQFVDAVANFADSVSLVNTGVQAAKVRGLAQGSWADNTFLGGNKDLYLGWRQEQGLGTFGRLMIAERKRLAKPSGAADVKDGAGTLKPMPHKVQKALPDLMNLCADELHALYSRRGPKGEAPNFGSDQAFISAMQAIAKAFYKYQETSQSEAYTGLTLLFSELYEGNMMTNLPASLQKAAGGGDEGVMSIVKGMAQLVMMFRALGENTFDAMVKKLKPGAFEAFVSNARGTIGRMMDDQDEEKSQKKKKSSGSDIGGGGEKKFELTDDDIERLLHALPIENADIVFFGAENDLWPLVLLHGYWLTKCYEATPMIAMSGGGAAGNTYHGHHQFELGDDPAIGIHYGHYTLYAKAMVTDTRRVQQRWNVHIERRIRGGGTTTMDPNNKRHRQMWAAGEFPADIHVYPIRPDDEAAQNETMLSATGFFHRDVAPQDRLEASPYFADKMAEFWGIINPENPLNRRPYSEPGQAFQPLVFETHQLAYKYLGENRWDETGNKVMNSGHFGIDWGYDGCSNVINGAQMYLERPDFSGVSKRAMVISSGSIAS